MVLSHFRHLHAADPSQRPVISVSLSKALREFNKVVQNRQALLEGPKRVANDAGDETEAEFPHRGRRRRRMAPRNITPAAPSPGLPSELDEPEPFDNLQGFGTIVSLLAREAAEARDARTKNHKSLWGRVRATYQYVLISSRGDSC